MTFDFDAIRKLPVEPATAAALVSDADNKKLVAGVVEKCNMVEQEALASIAIICQKGGTSKKAQGTVYSVVNGKRLDLNMIRNIMRETGCTFTLRQWARTNATNIYEVAKIFDIEGDLAKKIARNSPEVTQDEKYWISNFQMDNTDCPQNIREMLLNHYKVLFPGKTMES